MGHVQLPNSRACEYAECREPLHGAHYFFSRAWECALSWLFFGAFLRCIYRFESLI
jgi:hypothetical protein